MTKHSKLEVNETILKLFLPELDKHQIINLITETFTKKDLIEIILYMWKQANYTTNDKIEKYLQNNYRKRDEENL